MENQELSIKLTVAQWNIVMGVLGNGPYSTVAPLVEAIKGQAQNQLTPPTEGPTQ
jgi:hypothetical protein